MVRKSKQTIAPQTLISANEQNGLTAAPVFAVALLSSFAPVLVAAMFFVAFFNCATVAANVIMMVSSVLTALAFSVLGWLSPRFRSSLSTILCVVFCVCLCLALVIPDAREGFFSFANVVIAHFDIAFESYIGLLSSGAMVCNSVLFAVLFGVFIGMISWMITRFKRTGITLLCVVILGSLSLRLSLGFSGVASVLGIAAWFVQCRFTQLKNAQYSVPYFVIVIVAFVVSNLALFGICFAVYKPSPVIDSVHKSTDDAFLEARYGSDDLPEGDISKAYLMNSDDDKGLALTVKGSLSDDLLMRGFVGANFDGGQWKKLDYTAYEGEWKGVFTWLEDQGFISSEQRARYNDQESEETGRDQTGTAEISVDSSKANSRYFYTPYTLRSLDAAVHLDLDGSVQGGFIGDRSYDMVVDDVSKGDILADTSWLSESDSKYAQAERVYAAFAEEHYLDISDADKELINNYVFNSRTWDSSASESKYAVISRVRTMLQTLATYTDTPSAIPENESFLQWFFEESREGNSSYFATAATLAFRSQGIPARYVEGYRAAIDDISNAQEQNIPLSLKGKNTHAWCEVYLDGIGWTPMEVSPGFYSQATEADSVIEVSEAYSNGSKDISAGNESVSGLEEDESTETQADLPSTVAIVGLCVLVILGILLIGIAVLFIQRVGRIRHRQNLTQGDDQNICIPALYRYLTDIMEVSNCNFDAERPLDCEESFVQEFKGIDILEYRRVIEIYQAYTFGCRLLRPNELRTLRSFNERLYEALPKAEKTTKRFYRYFVRAL